MNPFENPIPKNPKELGQQHRIQKNEAKIEKEKAEEKKREEWERIPFDSMDGDNSPEAKDHSREEINFNLILKIQKYIDQTQKIIDTLPSDSYKRLELEEQIENNEVTLETLLSEISPADMEKLYDQYTKTSE